MIKFRFYLRSVQASMAACFHVRDREDLAKKINDRYGKYGTVNAEDIKCEHYGFDNRTGWNTFVISCKDGILGFTDAAI